MIRRLLLTAATVTTLLAGPAAIAAHAAGPAAATPTTAAAPQNSYGDWFCVAVYGTGVCQGDPFPDELPLVPQHIIPPLPIPIPSV